MTLQIFKEEGRLYVEISDPPKGLEESLIKLSTDGIVSSLEGFIPKKDEAIVPNKTANAVEVEQKERSQSPRPDIPNDFASTVKGIDDGFIEENPFAKTNDVKKNNNNDFYDDDDWA